MSSQFKYNYQGFLGGAVGWLFADLLLALAMLFLVANTVGVPPKPKLKLTPTPTPTATPSPTPSALLLDQGRITLKLTSIDPDKLNQRDRGAVADLEAKIKAQIFQRALQGRRAGITIAYGGADNTNQIGRALDVATEVYKVLDILGGEKFVFCKTLHYDPLFTLKEAHDTVVIDIYMFNTSVGGCNNLT